MAGEPGASVTYYARVRPGGDPRQPEGILRVIKGPDLLREEEFARSGDWAPTGFFRVPAPALDGTLTVEVDAEAGCMSSIWDTSSIRGLRPRRSTPH